MATFVVTTTNDENDGGSNGGGLSLREAIILANASDETDRTIRCSAETYCRNTRLHNARHRIGKSSDH